MKKTVMLVVCLCFIFLSGIKAQGQTIEDDTKEIYSSLDGETRDILNQLGVASDLSQDFFSISFSEILDCFVELFSKGAKEPLAYTIKVLCILISVSVFKGLARGFEDIMSLFCSFLCCAVSIEGISQCISALLSCINACSAFLAAYVPVFSVIVALSGSSTGALTYNTTVLAFSEIISQLVSKLLIPACAIMMSMGIALGVNGMFNGKRVAGFINKCITWSSYSVMSVFSAVLGLKGILSASVDGVSSRGIKLMLSSFIPVVGSAVSEAYSSIVGSISAAKGSVAVFGIVVAFALCLPVLIKGSLYSLSLSFLSFSSEAVGISTLPGIFGCIKSTVRLMNMAVVIQIFLTVISTGIMVLMRGGT